MNGHAKTRTIRRQLWVGFGVLVVLLVVAGAIGWTSLNGISRQVQQTLTAVREESRISAALLTDVAQTMQAGARYVESRDPRAVADFRRHGFAAHNAQRAMNNMGGQGAEEIALVARIDEGLSQLEVTYALAHRLSDLGRTQAAQLQAEAASPIAAALLQDMDRLGQMKATKIEAASQDLRDGASRWSLVVVVVIVVALVLAIAVGVTTVRAIYQPLGALVTHARELSEGNLGVRTSTAELPGEFETLAAAMNQTSESLSRVVAVAASTADDVASSAHDLASVSEQISLSASQMASAMSEVSTGAESQVQQLRQVDAILGSIRERAEGVLVGAEEVGILAGTIEQQAQAKRQEIDKALAILSDVRATVQRAAGEVVELDRTAESINKFVGSVSRIAEQTNLLALNAAIEAARAGHAGRGFAVVADEVRKLAEQAQAAADDVVQLTSVVTARVKSSSQAMEAGASRVNEIEKVSHDIDGALSTIHSAAERTRRAAGGVAREAQENMTHVETAVSGISLIARTAEGHAAAAQEVSASTEEQSAACEEMSSASSHLLHGSTQLRELVGGLKTSS